MRMSQYFLLYTTKQIGLYKENQCIVVEDLYVFLSVCVTLEWRRECSQFYCSSVSGLSEQAEKIKETVDTEVTPLPEPSLGARLLQPPPAIAQSEQNWPLLTVSRGFFDR